MFLLLGAFFAGMITVFAPCIFALLPVIVGGSISGNVEDKRRPLIITASLAVSLIVFTVLLKATTLFIDISPGYHLHLRWYHRRSWYFDSFPSDIRTHYPVL